jgi:hypothetical protein
VRARITAIARRLPVIASVAALSIGVGACKVDQELQHPTNVDGEQEYVDAGPVTYQVQLTRELNPYLTEDRNYLAGVANATTIAPNEVWFAIFMWAKNQTKSDQTTSDQFTVTDSAGNTYYPVSIPSTNPFAWTAQTLGPGGTEPGPDTAAIFGPTQGGALIFKLNDSAYSNRPLTLNIFAPGQSQPSTVSLDL